MKKRIAAAVALAAPLLVTSAVPAGAAPSGYEVLDHDQKDADDHDHDGDGRPDHDPEDHDDDKDDKKKPKEH